MKIIEKVEIKHFRSFGEMVEILNVKDLNIFSGSNDSGKSNVLRALNLFFTEKNIDLYNQFIFAKDFSRFREEELKKQKKGKSFIEISILFNLEHVDYKSKVLPKRFFIIKRFFSNDFGSVIIETRDYKKKKLNKKDLSRATTNFLKKINFQYVPAIKDKDYFQYLKNLYQEAINYSTININNDEKMTFSELKTKLSAKTITEILEEKIKEESTKLFELFVENTKEISTAAFNIPDLKIDYSKVVDINTDENIPLNSRGDGIQAKFIPVILDEICNRNTSQNISIWAFEEPENSFEYKNAALLAQSFLEKYSKKYQIFLTTHSFNFITLEDESVSKYRIYKEIRKIETKSEVLKDFSTSTVAVIDNQNREEVEGELGIYELNEKLSKVYQEYIEKKESSINEIKKLECLLLDIKPQKIFICEDSNQGVVELWQRWFDIFKIRNVHIYTSNGCANYDIEIGIEHVINNDQNYKPKVFRQIDGDGLTATQKDFITDYFNKKIKNRDKIMEYKCSFLPVNEIENFYVLVNSAFDDSFFKNHKQFLIDKFDLTAEALLKKYANLDPSSVLFKNNSGSYASVYQEMRKDLSEEKWKYLLPGKNICAKVNNVNIINELSKIENEDLPQELSEYLKNIKSFYEN